MFDGLDQFLAFIGAVVCLVVVIGGAYRLWQLGVHDWLDALNTCVARVYWKVPKRTLVVLPAQASNVWWEMGQKDGAPCMQVVGEFFFTNISSEPVLVPKTYVVVYEHGIGLSRRPTGLKGIFLCDRLRGIYMATPIFPHAG